MALRGSGGARVGSGRKSKQVVDMTIYRGSVEDSGVPIEPMEGMNLRAQVVWRLYAPLAMEMRTLIENTVPGFRLLCEAVADLQEVQGQIESEPRAPGEPPHPQMRNLSTLYKQVESLMARFMLVPMGKPISVKDKPKKKATGTHGPSDAEYFGN